MKKVVEEEEKKIFFKEVHPPILDKDSKERKSLWANLKSLGCIGLLDRLWNITSQVVPREIVGEEEILSKINGIVWGQPKHNTKQVINHTYWFKNG